MEIDKREIMNKLDGLKDEELKSIVRSIALAAGVSERRAEQAVSDVKKLRRSIGGMNDRDLQNALSLLDEKTVEDIKKQIDM